MPDELTGQAKLFDALTTKGTAFTHDERCRYGLLGLLPTAEKTLDQQTEHSWNEFSTRRDDLDKHIYLRALQDRTKHCSTESCVTTSRRPCRLCTRRRSAWPASASARYTGDHAVSLCPTLTGTDSLR